METVIQASQIIALISAAIGTAALIQALILRGGTMNRPRSHRKMRRALWISGAALGTTLLAVTAGIRMHSSLPEPAEDITQVSSPGTIDDNLEWEEYLEYHRNLPRGTVSTPNLEQRTLVEVRDSLGKPVPGASIGAPNRKSYRTHQDGAVFIYPAPSQETNLPASNLLASRKGRTAPIDDRGPQPWRATLDIPPEEDPRLDVVILVDANAQTALKPISQALEETRIPGLQVGTVMHRSRLPLHLPSYHDPHPDPRVAALSILEIPEGTSQEPLGAALHQAGAHTPWRDSAARAVVILAQTPLQISPKEEETHYINQLAALHFHGARVHAIALVPADPQGEFILRQLAQQTRGTFTTTTPGLAGGTVLEIIRREMPEQPTRTPSDE